ncbi:HlyD family efflux transporter periplasmic adaptor subunit [Roseiconus nitratireducens]|uniref:HlyD family efflux transporter periplasmic adaptor subunit n=1 Tax=Roseiconus nitratireducens TaxID=2605748 RepID=A0A5M6D6A4_9BACT|nr:efflux RND transporter periplasmic adaptor subunit [Roseiconus nitratireducens]KAA5542276.1 HlyD family efflux transporter periplasmic adaptor subunit [Roseiconus nitratireducens]
MKQLIRLALFASLLGGVAFGIWYWQSLPDGDDANQLEVYGNVDVRQVELAINGNERIGELLVEEGDRVKKGDLLAKLETERLEYAVQRAKAIMESQRQVVARLEAGSRPEEIAKAKADVAQSKAIADETGQTFERKKMLRKSNAASQQELDDARAAYESAEAQLESRQSVLDLALAGPRQEDKDEARALLKRYEAELAQAEHDLKDGYLSAPSDGIIQDRILEVGDMASPQKTVFTLALVDPVWVRAYVSEPDLGKIFEGMKAYVFTDSFPGKEYEGWVGFISPTAEFTPKPVETRELRTKLVYQIRVFVKNPNNELRLGMPTTVRIPLDQPQPSQQTE